MKLTTKQKRDSPPMASKTRDEYEHSTEVVSARSGGALHDTFLPGGPLCSVCCVAGGLWRSRRLWLPGLLPGAGRAHTGACQRPGAPLARSRPGPGGVRSCRSADVRGRHYACRLRSTLVPGGPGGVGRTVWWQTCPHAPRTSLRSQGRSSGL
jgi:hypothetical protein